MERLTIKYGSGLYESINPIDIYNNEYSKSNYRDLTKRLGEYEDLVEQGKLLIKAYEIRTISECIHCNHVERRIEETWIQPELLQHDGFYKTQKEAEDALRELAGM